MNTLSNRPSPRIEILERVVAESRAEITSMTLDKKRLVDQLADLRQELWEARLRFKRTRLAEVQYAIAKLEQKVETHVATLSVYGIRIDRCKVRLHRSLEALASLRAA